MKATLFNENVGVVIVCIGAAVLLFACAIAAAARESMEDGRMHIRSTAFTDGGEIPAKYTSEGKDISPSLTWAGVPEEAKSLVLIVDDPDAPDPKAPRMVWVHWVLYNIPPNAAGLPDGVKSKRLPAGTAEGVNDWEKTGYGGPAPPIGRHRYFHKLYALDTLLEGLNQPTKAEVLKAMDGHIIARAELVGTYKKSR